DALSGGTGDDILDAGAGNDVMLAGAGDDVILCGEGDDIIFGGYGYDLFIYGAYDGNDDIMDFEEDCDEIKFDGDDLTYEVVLTDYGKNYVFKNGSVLSVHSNSGKGSSNSGKDKDKDDDDCDDDDKYFLSLDDDLDYSYLSLIDDNSGPGKSGDYDSEWSELVASGVIDLDPQSEYGQTPETEYTAWQADDDASSLLNVSTILFSNEDINLIA
ncbi:MAG: hypothetical protein HC850_04955, partial [Rhodomicrobium sp.]|nr:hypothetical protein [Rhodomicrobium sp.]